jgi:hypothetical protein
MRRSRAFLCQLTLVAVSFTGARPSSSETHGQSPDVQRILRASIEAVGGRRLAELRAVRLVGSASDELPGISPADAPPTAMYREYVELRDLDRVRIRRTSVVSLPMRPDSITFTEFVDSSAAAQSTGGAPVAGSRSQWREAIPWLTAGIERALLAALSDKGAWQAADTVVAGVTASTIVFANGLVRLYMIAAHSFRSRSRTCSRLKGTRRGECGAMLARSPFIPTGACSRADSGTPWSRRHGATASCFADGWCAASK